MFHSSVVVLSLLLATVNAQDPESNQMWRLRHRGNCSLRKQETWKILRA